MKQHTPKPLVLCEGKEDQLVIETLANHAGLTGRLSFQEYDGKDKLRSFLHLLKATPEYTRGEYSKVLITRDADTSYESSWAALAGAITEAFGCTVNKPGEWIEPDDGPELSAWIIPGPGQTGMIETLCVNSSIAKAPEVYECLDSFIGCLKAVQGEEPHEKTRFALWTIAAQGAGAQKRLSLKYAIPKLPIDWDDAAFTPLRDLLVGIAS